MSAIETKKVDPLDLLVPERLDIIVKYLYIQALETGGEVDYFTHLYDKHILERTGGRKTVYEYQDGEPKPVQTKEGVDAYRKDFSGLIQSIKKNGFDRSFFIPVSKQNGIILDGAHRASCSLYFNIRPDVLYEDRPGRTWDCRWFREHGFSEDEMHHILNAYIQLKAKNTFACILWGPLREHWDEIQEDLHQKHPVVAAQDYSFDPDAFASVVYDIYSQEFGVVPPEKITRKIALLKDYNTDMRVLFFHIQQPEYFQRDERCICKQAVELKNAIREQWDYKIPKEQFISIHITDNAEHTRHIQNIFLSTNNLAHLKGRGAVWYREEFLGWMDEYRALLKELNIPEDACCIVGSGPLEVMGIRPSTDIDFILDSRFRSGRFADVSANLSPNVDIVHRGYHEYRNTRNPISDDGIIRNPKNHFYFRGLKFANIQIVWDRKNNHRREKDVKDLILMEEFWRNSKHEENTTG